MRGGRRGLALGTALVAWGAALGLGCGGDDGPSYAERFARVAACTNLEAPMPALAFEPAVACPTSGELRCLPSVEPFPCPDDPSRRCGAAGRYDPATGTVVLPDVHDAAFEHECIHHLLQVTTGDPDTGHARPEFRCG